MAGSNDPIETIRIPNDATYSPIALSDIATAAPLLSRLVLGATLPGLALQAAALTVYAGSALQDWIQRLGVRPIDFMAEFGADLHHFDTMPVAVREAEVATLAERLNDGYTDQRPELAELAVLVDKHLTEYIAGITQQRVETSKEIRTFSLAGLLMPFALGASDILSGDVSLFVDSGCLQAHVVAHEFCHRKGYWRELDAQALAYLALTSSNDGALVQSALCERLHRDLRVLVGNREEEWDDRVRKLRLRPELERQLLMMRPSPAARGGVVGEMMREAYDVRMQLTGQNGVSDYDFGFTNFLYTFETSSTARQRPPKAGAVH